MGVQSPNFLADVLLILGVGKLKEPLGLFAFDDVGSQFVRHFLGSYDESLAVDGLVDVLL